MLLKLAGTVLSLINTRLCYVNEEKLHNFGTKVVNTGHSGPEYSALQNTELKIYDLFWHCCLAKSNETKWRGKSNLFEMSI